MDDADFWSMEIDSMDRDDNPWDEFEYDGRDLAQVIAEDEPEVEEYVDCPIHGITRGTSDCPRC